MILFKRGKTGKTGNQLRKAIGCRSTISWERNIVREQSVNRVIRWGNSDEFANYGETLNSAEAISKSANKLEALKTLDELGISIPKLFTNKDDVNVYPVIGRTTYHQGGSGFKVVGGECHLRDDTESTHWLEFIDKVSEFRVHVFKGEVIGVSRKTDEDVEYRITNTYAWNHENGYRFIRCDLERVQHRLKELAVQAITALGLDFGAVDIILSDGNESTSSGGRRYYVLEINSAPSLEKDSTIFSKYVSKFKEWLFRQNG